MEKHVPLLTNAIFLGFFQDSKFCKYDELCERDFCMFKHIKKNEDGRDFQVEENDIIKIRSDFGEDEQEDEIDEHDDTVNKTFINPTQVDTNDGDLRLNVRFVISGQKVNLKSITTEQQVIIGAAFAIQVSLARKN